MKEYELFLPLYFNALLIRFWITRFSAAASPLINGKAEATEVSIVKLRFSISGWLLAIASAIRSFATINCDS